MDFDIAQRLERVVGESVEVEEVERVSGGDISEAVRVDTPRGGLFVKWVTGGPSDLFEREAEALERMRGSGTSLRIPQVLGVAGGVDAPATLVLEYIGSGRPAGDYDEQLGRGLAELHTERAESFGFDHDNYCGTTPQPNDWTDDWVEFYREHRLRHLLGLIEHRREVSQQERRDLQRLMGRLDELLDASEPPSLIHGDLWSGNVFADGQGRPVVVDPAAYYGHPEAELGMMDLFGGFSQTVYDAYLEARSLPAGWQSRIPVYALYHLLNHYYLFGGHYRQRAFGQARRIAGK